MHAMPKLAKVVTVTRACRRAERFLKDMNVAPGALRTGPSAATISRRDSARQMRCAPKRLQSARNCSVSGAAYPTPRRGACRLRPKSAPGLHIVPQIGPDPRADRPGGSHGAADGSFDLGDRLGDRGAEDLGLALGAQYVI